jgi:hypothetical protein
MAREQTHKSSQTVVSEFEQLFDITNDPKLPDVACVILVTSFLNDALGALLDARFVGVSTKNIILAPENGLLGSLQAKANIAYCMNLITKGCASNIRRIGEIRNKFAHKFPAVTFNDAEVIEKVEKLTPPRGQIQWIPDTPAMREAGERIYGKGNPRLRFVMISQVLCSTIVTNAWEKLPPIQPCDDMWDPWPTPSTDQPSVTPPDRIAPLPPDGEDRSQSAQ